MRVSKKLVKINKAIKRFEQHGYEFYLHHSIFEEPRYEIECGAPVRGVTTLYVKIPQVGVFRTVAFCSVDDNFSKIVGTQIAFKRAMEYLSTVLGREALKDILDA